MFTSNTNNTRGTDFCSTYAENGRFQSEDAGEEAAEPADQCAVSSHQHAERRQRRLRYDLFNVLRQSSTVVFNVSVFVALIVPSLMQRETTACIN